MPPNAAFDYSTSNSQYPPGVTHDPLLNFSYYPSTANYSADFGSALGTSAPSGNTFSGVGGLATDANSPPYTTGSSDPLAFDYNSGNRVTSNSWLHGDDYLNYPTSSNKSTTNMSTGNFLNSDPSFLPNLSSVNLDQIKIVRFDESD